MSDPDKNRNVNDERDLELDVEEISDLETTGGADDDVRGGGGSRQGVEQGDVGAKIC